MNALEKLKLLGPPTCFEPAEEVVGTRRPPPCPGKGDDDLAGMIHNAVMPGGKRIALLKTMLTSACERDCAYCGFRQGRDFRRAGEIIITLAWRQPARPHDLLRRFKAGWWSQQLEFFHQHVHCSLPLLLYEQTF